MNSAQEAFLFSMEKVGYAWELLWCGNDIVRSIIGHKLGYHTCGRQGKVGLRTASERATSSDPQTLVSNATRNAVFVSEQVKCNLMIRAINHKGWTE